MVGPQMATEIIQTMETPTLVDSNLNKELEWCQLSMFITILLNTIIIYLQSTLWYSLYLHSDFNLLDTSSCTPDTLWYSLDLHSDFNLLDTSSCTPNTQSTL